MDKTLETVVLVHRLILVVAFALFVVGISVHRPSLIYGSAQAELQSLEEGIQGVSGQVNKAYEAIYEKSELKASTIAWLKRRNVTQQKFDIQIINPSDIAVPDPARNPLVTLEAQVKWADRTYRDLSSQFFLCSVDRVQVFRALDKVFGTAIRPELTQLVVYVHEAQAGPYVDHQLRCEVDVQYEVQNGTMSGLRAVKLDLPTTVIVVTQVEPPGPNWIDLGIAGTLKEHGLGDYDDLYGLNIPSLRELWTGISDLPPEAVNAFLKQKKTEEAEKAKEKIEILGQSLSGSLTIIMATVVELFLMVYLLATLMQIRMILPGHEAAVSESPFFGIMHSRLGQLVMISTLFIIPLGVSFFVIIVVLPSFQSEWPGPLWLVSSISKWTLIGAIGMAGLILIRHVYGIRGQLPHASRMPPSLAPETPV